MIILNVGLITPQPAFDPISKWIYLHIKKKYVMDILPICVESFVKIYKLFHVYTVLVLELK